MRPLVDPAKEKLTVVVNGVDDNRDWKVETDVLPYDEDAGNVIELIRGDGSSCNLPNTNQVPRFGSSAGFANNLVSFRD